MASVGDTLPHCTGTGTQANPYIYTTEEGFKEAVEVDAAYVAAASTDLVFDANNRVLTKITLRCKSIDGRGTTIRNLLAKDQTINIIEIIAKSGTGHMEFKDLNFYNMCIFSSSADYTPRFLKETRRPQDSEDAKNHSFIRCNFTGIIRGACHTSGYFESENAYSFSAYYNYLRFIDCTFNINIVDTGTSSRTIFKGRDVDLPYMDNCTICVSGQSNVQSGNSFYIINGFRCNNCVFENVTPLELKGDFSTGQPYVQFSFSSETSYNYIKVIIIGNSSSSSGAQNFILNGSNSSYTLLNISLLTNCTINNTFIKMQQDDPTASDYIYNAENLANAGFLIGQVVE